MTISYKWLSEYLPVEVDPERLSRILTSIGLEVEKMEKFEEVKGGLEGLLIGHVKETEKHPNADKLTLTKVDIGTGDLLQIVCGAPNVAAGQKVIVATVGTTIYPTKGDPLTMKTAKIRGTESQGMICAEDEIGLGDSHAGIMVLPEDAQTGTKASDHFKPFSDIIYEIGLTPNRADAMSHWGVARDVCAYLTHHDKKEVKPVIPASSFKVDKKSLSLQIDVENTNACPRYSGVCITDITVAPSPRWMQERLKAIGVRPINNIVDITNFIQHETGQPLHAFDFNAIKGEKIVVKNLPEGTLFKTLDDKERKLSAEDLMICNAEDGMCIAGVFGGIKSGVTEKTKTIFLESAYFDPAAIRKTSFRHGLRTDAATRFEKGIDISGTVTVLKRAAELIKELAGGKIASEILDVYPKPVPKAEIILKYQYLRKLSGKNYHPDTVNNILRSLGFTIMREGGDAMLMEVPYHKHDVTIPADVVEEILRIDGLDNIDIPSSVTMTPSVETNSTEESLKEKVSNTLVGMGFSEILTNSITGSRYLTEGQLQETVKLMNSLSAELDVMRPTMLPTALEVIAFNVNRKSPDLKFFEFGKTYGVGPDEFYETLHLSLYLTGNVQASGWRSKSSAVDFHYAKGVAESVLKLLGLPVKLSPWKTDQLEQVMTSEIDGALIVVLGKVTNSTLKTFDIKQPVYIIDFNWDAVLSYVEKKVAFKEIPRFPAMERDLAMVVPSGMKYKEIKQKIDDLSLPRLKNIRLFDIFESDKLGKDKKSLAINFTFLDEEKTMTDKEVDSFMSRIMTSLEKDLGVEIRK